VRIYYFSNLYQNPLLADRVGCLSIEITP